MFVLGDEGNVRLTHSGKALTIPHMIITAKVLDNHDRITYLRYRTATEKLNA